VAPVSAASVMLQALRPVRTSVWSDSRPSSFHPPQGSDGRSRWYRASTTGIGLLGNSGIPTALAAVRKSDRRTERSILVHPASTPAGNKFVRAQLRNFFLCPSLRPPDRNRQSCLW